MAVYKAKKGIYTNKKGMHKRQVEIKMRFLFVLCVCAFTGEFSCVFFRFFFIGAKDEYSQGAVAVFPGNLPDCWC